MKRVKIKNSAIPLEVITYIGISIHSTQIYGKSKWKSKHFKFLEGAGGVESMINKWKEEKAIYEVKYNENTDWEITHAELTVSTVNGGKYTEKTDISMKLDNANPITIKKILKPLLKTKDSFYNMETIK